MDTFELDGFHFLWLCKHGRLEGSELVSEISFDDFRAQEGSDQMSTLYFSLSFISPNGRGLFSYSQITRHFARTWT